MARDRRTVPIRLPGNGRAAKLIPPGAFKQPKDVPLLVLDLDGTVRKGYEELGRFVNGPEDVEVYPGVVDRMRWWRRHGGRILGLTNQGGVALGHTTLERCIAGLEETMRQCERLFDHIAACTHHPDAAEPGQARCWCRKPSPGNLVIAARMIGFANQEMYPAHLGIVVGDRDEDRDCAKLAGFGFLEASVWRTRPPEDIVCHDEHHVFLYPLSDKCDCRKRGVFEPPPSSVEAP